MKKIYLRLNEYIPRRPSDMIIGKDEIINVSGINRDRGKLKKKLKKI